MVTCSSRSSSQPSPRALWPSQRAVWWMRPPWSLPSTRLARLAQWPRLERAPTRLPTLTSAPRFKRCRLCKACRSGVLSSLSGFEPISLAPLPIFFSFVASCKSISHRSTAGSVCQPQVRGGLDLEAGCARGARDSCIGPEHRDHQPLLQLWRSNGEAQAKPNSKVEILPVCIF